MNVKCLLPIILRHLLLLTNQKVEIKSMILKSERPGFIALIGYVDRYFSQKTQLISLTCKIGLIFVHSL